MQEDKGHKNHLQDPVMLSTFSPSLVKDQSAGKHWLDVKFGFGNCFVINIVKMLNKKYSPTLIFNCTVPLFKANVCKNALMFTQNICASF